MSDKGEKWNLRFRNISIALSCVVTVIGIFGSLWQFLSIQKEARDPAAEVDRHTELLEQAIFENTKEVKRAIRDVNTRVGDLDGRLRSSEIRLERHEARLFSVE